MGLFSKVKKAVKSIGNVFSGALKGLDKLTGGKLSKFLGNKWVKGALMAASIVTGGIAVANGVMAAGQAGIGEAVKQFATNMTAETGGNLFSTVIDAGKEFVAGVAKGYANPLGSDAGQKLTGMLDSAVGNLTGEAVTATDMAMAPEVSQAQSVNAAAGADPQNIALGAGEAPAVADAAAAGDYTLQGMQEASQAPQLASTGDPMSVLGGDVPPVDPSASQYGTYTFDGSSGDIGAALGDAAPTMTDMANAMNPGAGAMTPPGMPTPAAAAQEGDFLSRMLKKAEDFATSPAGMQMIGNTMTGWAQGEMMQKRWDDLRKDEKRRYKSWTDGSYRHPRFARGGN